MSEAINENLRPEKSNLHQYIDKFFDMLVLYDDIKSQNSNSKFKHDYKGLLKATIDVFLEFESQYTAYEVYENFLMIYQITPEDKSEIDEDSPNSIISEPNTLLDLVDLMKKYEENTGDLINRQRDHFIHSVNVFVLGLAIYAKNENYREIFREYIVDNEYYKKYYRTPDDEFSHEEFLYRWGIAALFHDIGYPFEIIGKQIDKVIEDGVMSISVNYDVTAHVDFRDFNEFNSIVKIPPYDYADKFRDRYKETKVLDLFKPTDIMAHKIAMDFDFDKFQLKKLVKHLNSFVRYMNENGFVDHGYFSAILVLNSYGKLIQQYIEKDKDFFFYPIVDSATAILLHNYYNKTLQSKLFGLGKLDPACSPISYLLIFCDELQEWNRRPYGVLDKQKNHVNDFDVEIDGDKIIVRYILKNGSMGLGFEEMKDEFINEVLDVRKIFPAKLSILPKVDLDDVQRDSLLADIKAPDVLMRNIEKLAHEINEQYRRTAGEDKPSFNELNSDLKMSNIRQAKSIPKKLALIGCEIAHKTEEELADTRDFDTKLQQIVEENYGKGTNIDDISDEIIEENSKIVRILKFSNKDINDLAIYEHDEWCDERIGKGWKPGIKSIENKTTPCLVEWGKLDDQSRQYDIDTIKNIPRLLDNIGLKIIRSRMRALTYKMNQFYEYGKLDSNSSGEKEFKGLDNHIQFCNLKQANHLVHILKDKGYEFVSLDDPREIVETFDYDEIEHFAKREHESWYKLKLNLNKVSSRNFVEWDDLDRKVKHKNRETIRHLPDMCADKYVGLKIVRSE
ncbi:RyR domain-containing protein [Methanobrevibacter sp.]|uniref:RyR domain-containing protein n=1 Tax=Methanobrevibacter sp. TaxID=66852 RepID=UPI0038910545